MSPKLYFKKAFTTFQGKHYANARIKHTQKIIFIHIPKTAGNSITQALNALDDPLAASSPKISKHYKAAEVRYLLGQGIWDDYFSFSFVRNPWDLMVSSYHWWLQKAPKLSQYHHKNAKKVQEMGSFEVFMQSDLGKYYINERKGNYQDWLTDKNEKVIVDYIGKVEELQQCWDEICKQNGLPLQQVAHVNKSERKPYQSYYTPEIQAQVAERFAWSIDKFGYAFE